MGCTCSSSIVVYENYDDKHVIHNLPSKDDIIPYLSKLSGANKVDIVGTEDTKLGYTLYTIKDMAEQQSFIGLFYLKVLYVYKPSDALPLWSMIHTLLDLIPVTKKKLPRELIQALGTFATSLARGNITDHGPEI